MNSPKPKTRRELDDVILVPLSPSRQRRRRWQFSIAAVSAVIIAFVVGTLLGSGKLVDSTESNLRLRTDLVTARGDLKKARNELAVYRSETEVAAQAREQLRQEIKALSDQVAELEEATAFYKSVMAPGDGDGGLQIERLDISPGAEEGEYRYRLVLVQGGGSDADLAGAVTFRLYGMRDGEAVDIRQGEVLVDGSETRFRFRYFQELKGSFIVPDGLEVTRIAVEAESTGRRRQQSEKTIELQ